MRYYTKTNSPIGELLLFSDGTAITGLYGMPHKGAPTPGPHQEPEEAPFAKVLDELDRYWSGQLKEFTIPLAPLGTPFQQRVWSALRAIPYATTISYGELAKRVGSPLAARAVGGANARNPISVIVPCHRVIGSKGILTGYAGGISRKEQLLGHESRWLVSS